VGGAGQRKKKQRRQRPSDEPGQGRGPEAQQQARERQQRIKRKLTEQSSDEGQQGQRLRLASNEAEQPGSRTAPSSWNLAGRCTPEDEAQLTGALLRMVTQLRAVTSRRKRQGRRGPLDVQAALRKNLSTYGVPLHLPRRERRRRPPKLLLLVDVSYSAIRASGLFILAAAWLMDHFRDARTLFFVNEPVDVTHTLRRWLDGRLDAPEVRAHAGQMVRRRRGAEAGAGICARAGGPSFRALIESLEEIELGAPSDYGRVLELTLKHWQGAIDRRTLVLLFGDGRNNRFPACPWFLEQIGEQARQLLWLIPEPAERWATGDSAFAEYLPAVDLACEATSLEGLLDGLRQCARF